MEMKILKVLLIFSSILVTFAKYNIYLDRLEDQMAGNKDSMLDASNGRVKKFNRTL
jgi:hypothetical protein